MTWTVVGFFWIRSKMRFTSRSRTLASPELVPDHDDHREVIASCPSRCAASPRSSIRRSGRRRNPARAVTSPSIIIALSVVGRTRKRGCGAVVTIVTSRFSGSASMQPLDAVLQDLQVLPEPRPIPLSSSSWTLTGQLTGSTLTIFASTPPSITRRSPGSSDGHRIPGRVRDAGVELKLLLCARVAGCRAQNQCDCYQKLRPHA